MKNGKPKALIFFQYLPPWRIDVFNEMAKYYQLTIVYTNADVDGFKYDRQDLLSRLDKDINNIFLNNGFKIGKRPVRFGILKLIKSINPDIIFSHEYTPTSIMVATYRKFKIANFKYVITTSDNLAIAKQVKGIKATFRQYVLSNADAAVVYSEMVKEFYTENFINLKVEICPNIQNSATLLKKREHFPSIINNYIDTFNLNESKVLLYTGRLEKVKGLDLLLHAFSKMDNNNLKLVLVGNGSEKENLNQICQKLNIEDKVIFPGFYSGNALYAWYDLADLYILPSRFEPFGAVVNEALVYGCPVMASKYIGATDFITNQNGILFDPLNKNEFISTLNQFYNQTNTKSNLMPVSFEAYVKVFYTIYHEDRI
jgi:glycosyltransferase involved in cell wall biosynthesis